MRASRSSSSRYVGDAVEMYLEGICGEVIVRSLRFFCPRFGALLLLLLLFGVLAGVHDPGEVSGVQQTVV